MLKKIFILVTFFIPIIGRADIDLSANEIPIHTAINPKAVALIPADYKFVSPGTLTVAISALNSPPLSVLASDNKTRIGSDPDLALLLADSLGLKLKLVPTAWEDWPLGIASGKYDVALVNIAVTEQRKEKYDFATYRGDSLAFSVKHDSPIQKISEPKDIADLKIIVQSGTNQERILLGWNAVNQANGLQPAELLYVTDDASGSLFIQSGRADATFGPQAVAAYKAALKGKTRVVGLGPIKALVATTTKKDNGLVYALQEAINGVIKTGEYQQILSRWGEEGEMLSHSDINPPGITY
ncbi:transporter substrate-binding domain-containing protein [Thorsellia kenyensis]|uniref:Transporter substrate-binding domain-containing protein n=1 Tax=Thorsellia kenyensis TaxID=1549888 RepID=A0ABV6CB85_9GAMM